MYGTQRPCRSRAAAALFSVLGVVACQPTDMSPATDSVDSGRNQATELPDYRSTRPGFCARTGTDAVRDIFCSTELPEIRNLRDLQGRLGLGFPPPSGSGGSDAGRLGAYDDYAGYTLAVALDHSTALSGQVVSPINPRVILLGANALLAFNRGVQQAEIVSRDREKLVFNFYLVDFEQACNTASHGCTPGDLYTPRIEFDWSRVRVRDDEELKNTPSDCRQCHRRARETPVLLMRELEGPWMHFFAPDQGEPPAEYADALGSQLVGDYRAAKGDESYGGISVDALRMTLGQTLQAVVDAEQPLVFDSGAILDQRFPYGPDGYAKVPQRSPMWDAAYAAFKRGEQLPLPYFAARPTDPDKQAKLTAAYQRYRAKEIAEKDLPDLGDIFPDDPQTRSEVGLQIEPGATPAEALVQACGSCHNDVLDQSISRARFSVALGRMERAELDVALARVKIPRGEPGCMPPVGRRQLDDEGRHRLLTYLQRNVRSSDDDALLERAAKLGMAGVQP